MEHDTLWQALLFDFYGELLTEKQRLLYDLHYNQDYSLAEIAQDQGISRQGVHDTIARAEQALRRFEEKTGCVARHLALQQCLPAIRAAAAELAALEDPVARRLGGQITGIIDAIKE